MGQTDGQTTTWHCPLCSCAPCCGVAAAIDRRLLSAGPTAANPQQRRVAAANDGLDQSGLQSKVPVPQFYSLHSGQQCSLSCLCPWAPNEIKHVLKHAMLDTFYCNKLTDRVKVLCPTRHEAGHFTDILPRQPLDLVL